MEHKLNESEKMVAFFKETFGCRSKPILESKDTALITQGIKCSKFSRPQIDLEDIMKFDKVAAMLQKMIWTKKFWNKPKSKSSILVILKRKKNADKLFRLVKIPENFDYEKSNRCQQNKIKQDSSGNYFSSIKNQWCFTK
jgi:tRNA uridine 5-carboxymethylaminomethyl modification enzyme